MLQYCTTFLTMLPAASIWFQGRLLIFYYVQNVTIWFDFCLCASWHLKTSNSTQVSLWSQITSLTFFFFLLAIKQNFKLYFLWFFFTILLIFFKQNCFLFLDQYPELTFSLKFSFTDDNYVTFKKNLCVNQQVFWRISGQ